VAWSVGKRRAFVESDDVIQDSLEIGDILRLRVHMPANDFQQRAGLHFLPLSMLFVPLT
jgi:hypothetical protein